MKIKGTYIERQMFGKTMVMSTNITRLRKKQMMVLNKTGLFLWEQAQQGPFTPESLTNALLEKYEVTLEVARNSVNRTIDSWQSAGFIEEE